MSNQAGDWVDKEGSREYKIGSDDRSRFVSKQEKFFSRWTPRNSGPQSRDSPPKRDTGIANEKDWGIILLNENVNESGTNEDGSTWFRESKEDLGDNGYRCRWTRMGGQSHDGTSEWKETIGCSVSIKSLFDSTKIVASGSKNGSEY